MRPRDSTEVVRAQPAELRGVGGVGGVGRVGRVGGVGGQSAVVAWVAFGTVRQLVLIFEAVTAPFLIFAPVTALFFSCFVPTLFLGSLSAA
jgi:hypothetical protein